MRFCMAVKTSPAGKDVSNMFSKTAPKKELKKYLYLKYKCFTQLQKFARITFLGEWYKHKTYNIQAENSCTI